jgi:hypothetical protein
MTRSFLSDLVSDKVKPDIVNIRGLNLAVVKLTTVGSEPPAESAFEFEFDFD